MIMFLLICTWSDMTTSTDYIGDYDHARETLERRESSKNEQGDYAKCLIIPKEINSESDMEPKNDL